MNHLQGIRGQLLQATKVQLNPVLPFNEPVGTRTVIITPERTEGRGNKKVIIPAVTREEPRYFYDAPDTYGVYRKSGGPSLGVVGKDFNPMDLNLFMDMVEQSCIQANLDLTKIKYEELKGGAKVFFTIDLKDYQLKSPKKGDIIQTRLNFKTGFDGLTKMGLNFETFRIWCSNGAKGWQNDISLSMKNTINNQVKIMTFTDEIMKVAARVELNVAALDELFKIPVTKKQMDAFLTKLTGFDVKHYADLTTKRRNILDNINNAIAIEVDNTGMNQFSLLQGITRHTTHNVFEGDRTAQFFSSGADMSDEAHRLLLEPVLAKLS